MTMTDVTEPMPQAIVDQKDVVDNETRKLVNMAIKAHEILFSTDSVFPFSLFPDTVTLDREKVTIAQRFFFRVAKVTSSRIKDIQGVELDIGPFFGSVKISSRFFEDDHTTVNFLSRRNALKLAKLIRGAVIAAQEEIDVRKTSKKDLLIILEDLGKGVSD